MSRKSRFGYISHLRSGEWNPEEFALVGERFVTRMVERFNDYGITPLESATILEIGCGVGRFLRPLAGRFKHVVGVDISPEMLRAAASYCAACPNVELHVTGGSSLQMIPDESLDYCVSAGVFQHITDQRVILDYVKEAARVLRPDGVFLFQFEGNRTDPVGIGQVGARITAGDLDDHLRGVPFTVREVSSDPHDPIRNVVCVVQKVAAGAVDFTTTPMRERPWLSGIYDGITTATVMRDRLNSAPLHLTFYD